MDINNIYILTSRVAAHRDRMETVADNVANVNTPGFKKITADYQETIPRRNGQEVGSFTTGLGDRIDFTPGGLSHTGNPFDLALVGNNAFFGVQRGDTTVYTRAGNFSIDATGQLVTPQGEAVLNAGGAPIVIPEGAARVSITKDGVITTDTEELGRVGTFTFADEDMPKLIRAGFGAWAKPESVEELQPEPGEVQVVQGSIENSNVQSVQEVTTMIEVSRAYQSALQTIQRMEDLDSRGIRELARMPQ